MYFENMSVAGLYFEPGGARTRTHRPICSRCFLLRRVHKHPRLQKCRQQHKKGVLSREGPAAREGQSQEQGAGPEPVSGLGFGSIVLTLLGEVPLSGSCRRNEQ